MKIKLVLFFTFYFLFFNLGEANAQTIDPSSWQTNATGLKTQPRVDKKTAGLGFIVEAQNWPFISIHGGVENANSYHGPTVFGPIKTELGQIKSPASSSSFVSETVDWSHNEMAFTYDTFSQLKLWISRLSPAVVTHAQSNIMQFLTGNVSGNVFITAQNPWETSVIPRTPSPSYPKYVAYQNGGNIVVQPLTSSNISLPSGVQWLLVWYGANSHFIDTKRPIIPNEFWKGDAYIPQSESFQADAPMLLVFQNSPLNVKHSSEGGIEVSFSANAGYATLLPILGRDHPKATDTENWGTSGNLPQSIKDKINFWKEHICNFPVSASESYSYNSTSDTVNITENITFMDVCNARTPTTFVPLPPALAISKDTFGIQFSGVVVDANLPTEFGPMMGINNTSSYSWNISGLNKYTDSKRILGNGTVPPELEEELVNEVNKIINDGHYAPWMFSDSIPRHDVRGDLYFANPADIIYHLSEIVSVLPSGITRDSLISYIQSERRNYPPEDVFHLLLTDGKYRQNYALDNSSVDNWNTYRQDLILDRVSLYNFFSLARYYELTAEPIPADVIQKAKNVFLTDFQEQDWASMFWFNGFSQNRVAVVASNRHAAGLIGFIKLMQLAQDTEGEELGRVLLAKAIVQRMSFLKYPQYLYSYNLVELPTNPAWQPQYTARRWFGHIFNYNWSDAYGDPRQVTVLDQFGVKLFEHSGFENWQYVVSSSLTSYRDMVPELARLLADKATQESNIYLEKVVAITPHWYTAFGEGILGAEHNLSHPIDSFQIFMAKSLIQKDTADNLRKYRDISWLSSGDLFYVQKLAEVVKAYKGWSWSDIQSTCTLIGDIDCSNSVNVLDLSILISKFGGSDTSSDLDNSGRVNVIDLSILLSNFGRSL